MSKCPQCDLVLEDSSNLRRHFLNAHDKKESYHCSQCASVFKRLDNLKSHIKAKHGSLGPKLMQCLQCDYETTDKSHLTRHVQTAHGNETHPCLLCNKKFG